MFSKQYTEPLVPVTDDLEESISDQESGKIRNLFLIVLWIFSLDKACRGTVNPHYNKIRHV